MSSASSMAPTFSDTKPQSAWVTPSGLSMAMRTNRALPPPLTSTSTSSRPSDCATRCAISSIFAATIATTSRIVPDLPPPTKKWAFAHRIGSTTQTTVYRVYGNCGRAEYGGALHHLHLFSPNSRTLPCYVRIVERPRAPHRAAATRHHPGQDQNLLRDRKGTR